MAKFAIGDKVDKAPDDHEGGIVVAVFSTTDGNFRYAVDMEGYGALQVFNEKELFVHTMCCRAAHGRSRPLRTRVGADFRRSRGVLRASSDRGFRKCCCRRPRRAGGR